MNDRSEDGEQQPAPATLVDKDADDFDANERDHDDEAVPVNIGKAGTVDYVDPDAGTGAEVFKEK